MTNSREKFEAWMTSDGKWPQAVELTKGGGYKLMQTHVAWAAWQPAFKAGRESMRDEAIDKLGDFDATKCAQIVGGIEP